MANSSFRVCDFSNVVTFGHNELWQTPAANSPFVTSEMLWPSAKNKLRRLNAANDLFVTLIWPQKWPIWQPYLASILLLSKQLLPDIDRRKETHIN